MAKRKAVALVFSCEHGGNRIPARYRSYFVGCESQLASHQGYDAGALVLARDFAQALKCKLFAATISRLLIDLNRSRGHRDLYSKVLRSAPQFVRTEIFEAYYRPYRDCVTQEIAMLIAQSRRVVHVSVHSFAPRLRGVVRNVDVGLLYDPSRRTEKAFVVAWQQALRVAMPTMTIRRNYPYAGKADGLTTALRRIYDDRVYAGIEIEINQKHVMTAPKDWRAFRASLVETTCVAFASA